MTKRKLGRTGLMVSQLGFGCIRFSSVDQATVTEALNKALDLGVNFLDTARNYRDSETKIGAALKTRRGEFHLATKTAARDADGLMRELEISLKELQMDCIDLYQLHTVSDNATYEKVMGPGGALEGAKKAQQQGKIKHIGCSIHRALDVMRKVILGGEFETVMLAYSPLDQEGVGKEIIPLAHSRGMGVIVMKPLSGGILTSAPPQGQPVPNDPIVRGCLRHVLSNPCVSTVILGMNYAREVMENVATAEMEQTITDAERQSLMKAIGKLGKSFRYGQVCLRCEYCQPCPQGIRIPEVFKAQSIVQGYQADLRYLGLELYKSLAVKPDACEECGECVKKCPAGLPIPQRLKEARKVIEAAAT